MYDALRFATDRILGIHEENTVDALKARLFDQGLTSSPAALLDTVLIESFEHYCQLAGTQYDIR